MFQRKEADARSRDMKAPNLEPATSAVDVRVPVGTSRGSRNKADRTLPPIDSKWDRIESLTDLGPNAAKDISIALNALLADSFALFLKTKNFHWHVSGPHFRDYHLLFDEQAAEILAMTDEIAERVRKLGESTLRSIGDIARLQRLADNDAPFVHPLDMLTELHRDNQNFIVSMRSAHGTCNAHNDMATASLIENYIDQAEKRAWFLYEAGRVPFLRERSQ